MILAILEYIDNDKWYEKVGEKRIDWCRNNLFFKKLFFYEYDNTSKKTFVNSFFF